MNMQDYMNINLAAEEVLQILRAALASSSWRPVQLTTNKTLCCSALLITQTRMWKATREILKHVVLETLRQRKCTAWKVMAIMDDKMTSAAALLHFGLCQPLKTRLKNLE